MKLFAAFQHLQLKVKWKIFEHWVIEIFQTDAIAMVSLFFFPRLPRKINPCEHQTVTNTFAHFTLHLLSFDSHIYIPLHKLWQANPPTRQPLRNFYRDGREFLRKKNKTRNKHESYWFGSFCLLCFLLGPNFNFQFSFFRFELPHVIWIFLTFSQP